MGPQEALLFLLTKPLLVSTNLGSPRPAPDFPQGSVVCRLGSSFINRYLQKPSLCQALCWALLDGFVAERSFEILTVRDSSLSPEIFPFGPQAWDVETQKPEAHSCLLCFLLSYLLPEAPEWKHNATPHIPIGQMRTEAQQGRDFPWIPGPGGCPVADRLGARLIIARCHCARWGSWGQGEGVLAAVPAAEERPQSRLRSPRPASPRVTVMLVGPGKRGVLNTETFGPQKDLLCLFLTSYPLWGLDFIWVFCLCLFG